MEQRLSDMIKNTIALLKNIELGTTVNKLIELDQKLSQKELTITVAGQFKRGKSTFINTVLGSEVLPVGIVPITSVVTKIRYGSERAFVTFESGDSQEIQLNELPDFISEQKNAENQKSVSYVDIFFPCNLLKSGIILVDTPGVGSMHRHNTDISYSFIKESDAVIFMLSVDSPINEIESEFLKASSQHANKFYFAINKTDTVTASDLADYLAYCENILCKIMQTQKLSLYPISAKHSDGMDALLNIIQRDIRTSLDTILADSVLVKLRDQLGSAISKVQLYRNALCMSANELERHQKNLAVQLSDLEKLAEEASIQMERQTVRLIREIESMMERKRPEVVKETLHALETDYQAHQDIESKLLKQRFTEFLGNNLKPRMKYLNDEYLDALKNGYRQIAQLLNDRISNMKSDFSNSLYSLFGTEYHSEETAYDLSPRSGFYVRVNLPPGGFLPEKDNLVMLLSRRRANEYLLNYFKKQVEEKINQNTTNMISDYRYKLTESKWVFNSIFQSEIESLKAETERVLSLVVADKQQAESQIAGKISALDRIGLQLLEYSETLHKNS
jgi:small GTP-binding protein